MIEYIKHIVFIMYVDQDLMRRIREQDETEAVADQSAEKTTKEKLYEAFKELIVLLETPEMRKRSYFVSILFYFFCHRHFFRTLNVFYSWLVVAMVYYGLSFNSKNLGADRYVSTFVSGFVEVSIRIQKAAFQDTVFK